MEAFFASIVLIVRALVVSARWAGKTRRCALEQLSAAADRRRVAVIRGLEQLSQLLDDFSEYYNHWRGHSTVGGALPSVIHRGDRWQRPDCSAKTLSGALERRLFPDTRVTAFRLAA